MLKTITNSIKDFMKENRRKEINPSGIFRAKITNELKYKSGSYEYSKSLILNCNCGDELYSPLDGIMVYNVKNGIVSIEHGHLFFDNKIRRVRTEYRNIKYIRMRENKGIDRLFECIRIKEGQSFAAVISEAEEIEFKLFIDNVLVDPEPYIIASYF